MAIMANPQKENGYVPIANEIFDAFSRYRIPGEARQILDAVIRKTYGWQKSEDEISLTQFQNLTGLSRSSVARAINWLVTKKLLVRYKEVTSFSNKYRFNKNFDTWVRGYKKDTTRKSNPGYEKVTESSYKKVNLPGYEKVTYKRHYTKDTSKDIDTLFKEFWEAYPKRNGKKIGKDITLQQFVKLEEPEQRQVVIAARNYFKSKNAQGGFAVDPVRFFKSREYPNGLWREWLEPETKEPNHSPSQQFIELVSDAANREYKPPCSKEISLAIYKICSRRNIQWRELHRQVSAHEIDIEELRKEFEEATH
jgi:phage replication O-like protein O